jgi:hypothetical protein
MLTVRLKLPPSRSRLYTLTLNKIAGQMFMDSAGVTWACDALLTASRNSTDGWTIASQALGAGVLGESRGIAPTQRVNGAVSGTVALASLGPAFAMHDAFGGIAPRNPFTAGACQPLALDDGFVAGHPELNGAAVLRLEPVLALESVERWVAVARRGPAASAPTYVPTHRGETVSGRWRPHRSAVRSRRQKGRWRWLPRAIEMLLADRARFGGTSADWAIDRWGPAIASPWLTSSSMPLGHLTRGTGPSHRRAIERL